MNPTLEVDAVRRHIEALLTKHPELRDDDDLLADCLQGETDAEDVLNKLVSQLRHDDTLSLAMTMRMVAIQKRQTGVDRRRDSTRAAIKSIMDAAGQRKWVLPEATLSIRSTPASVHVLDEAQIPDEFWRVKREPNKTAIKEALLDGTEVPGATLSNGGESLSVRI